MQTSERHIINKVFLEINTPSKDKAYYLKDHLDAFLKEELFPLLETYFDTLGSKIASQSIQIEKLNMDFSVANDLNFNSIKLEIMNQFQNQIEKQIDNGFPNTKQYTLITKKEKDINEFFSFLETGTTPWWVISKNILDINSGNQFEKIISDKAFSSKLLNALENSQTRIRFTKQLSDDQIDIILKKTLLLELASEVTVPNKSTEYDCIQKIKDNMNSIISKSNHGLHQRNLIWDITLLQLLKHNDSTIREKLFKLITSFDLIRKYNAQFALEEINKQITNKSVLNVLSNLANEVSIIAVILEQKAVEILQKNNKDQSVQSEFSKTGENELETFSSKKNAEIKAVLNTNEEIEEKESLPDSLFLSEESSPETPSNYYVNNAGLILVHPFLKQLFENCKLLNKDNTINNREVAAHLLHYVATEQEQDYEHEMLFEKLLCNIPVNQTINRNIILSEELKNHADEMLRAVLENWKVMKNSSVGLLRNEYLKRPGKIILTGDNPKLLVERKTQDILLDKIDWNLGIVKLAWKNKVIFVDW
ncbi:contractile injection system tape measure protein [Flavobacterium sp. MMLR14_040]|uniref:contractile injection system tape measure protein n=1 Tax=Flavobacterium sp. MMLR14_040 TaxID=3093843 RepID=UPI0029903FCC|nr:contractile injection system tape measure protein [Flavobacterium sp. MMLR14_040]MDW8850067.1 contractile injection system tape measure protein [Flavobacterium sp. MMLR14_040]